MTFILVLSMSKPQCGNDAKRLRTCLSRDGGDSCCGAVIVTSGLGNDSDIKMLLTVRHES